MKDIPTTQLKRKKRLAFVVLLALAFMLTIVTTSQSAYQVQRPISDNDNQINQTYLWATVWNGQEHRGVDFTNTTGIDVFAVANGVVVDMEEGIPNGTYPPGSPWGNFVLIRHDGPTHYDQTTDSKAHVYSIYAHLSRNSVNFDEGDPVAANDHIADIDDTGNSSGSHLHFQIVLNPSTDLDSIELEPNNTLDSENRSRNPELWLSPLPVTGTAIGKVTEADGDPAVNLVVCGMEKEDLAYTTSRTYSFEWVDPDDILHENFGTTDVSPGTYDLYAAAYGTTCDGYDEYLGEYTFTGGATTYIGLYPAWLPVVRPTTTWDAQLFIRNHSSTVRNVSYTTFSHYSTVLEQYERNSNFRGTAIVADEKRTAISGMVVPSQDSSTLLVTTRYGQPAGYTGVVAAKVNNDVKISSAWERVGQTLYAPLVKKNWSNRSSIIYVTNTGTSSTIVFVTYYKDGLGNGGGSAEIAPNTQANFTPSAPLADGYYSAVIFSTTQPIAAVVLEGEGSGTGTWPASYNALKGGNTNLYAPQVKKNYAGNTTGITLQNISSSSANFQARYYDMDGNQQGGTISGTISPNSPYVIYNPSDIPDGFLGSVRIISTNGQPLVGQVSESNGSGGLRLMSNLALGGSPIIYLPLWYDNYALDGDWRSGVNIQNLGTGVNNITVTWYNQDGTQPANSTQTIQLVNTNDTHNIYDHPQLNNFIGSVVIQSTSNKPIAAVSNVRNWAATVGTDSAFAFNGSNR